MKIRFFKPYITGNEIKYIQDIINNKLDSSGDGKYTKKVHQLMQKKYGVPKVLLTTSCSSALEFAVRLSNLIPGDEVIVPSFTFSSTANAILLNSGVKAVFADINPHTFNIDPKSIKKKITRRTRAIIVVHYAGVACDMDAIMKIARQHNLIVIEDAAQAIEAKYKGQYLGTIGDFGCISFHDTKNIICGEGGALFINTKSRKVIERAEIIREKGTNRSRFFRGLVDKYTWVDLGNSYLPSDILAAYLYAQLQEAENITSQRMNVYNFYVNAFKKYEEIGVLKMPTIPSYAKHNAHIFYLTLNTESARNFLIDFCKKKKIGAPFHYIPLHSSPFGKKIGNKPSDLPITEEYSKRLIRLPLYAGMKKKEMEYVVENIKEALHEIMKKENKIIVVESKKKPIVSQLFFGVKNITFISKII